MSAKRLPPEVVTALVEGLLKDIVFAHELNFTTKCRDHEGFIRRSQIYRLAAVMMALVVGEQHDARLTEVRETMEHRAYGPEETPEAVIFVGVVKEAMADLSDLFQILRNRTRKELTWCRVWFEAAGIEETNVETFRQFVMNWVNLYSTVSKAIDRMLAEN